MVNNAELLKRGDTKGEVGLYVEQDFTSIFACLSLILYLIMLLNVKLYRSA